MDRELELKRSHPQYRTLSDAGGGFAGSTEALHGWLRGWLSSNPVVGAAQMFQQSFPRPAVPVNARDQLLAQLKARDPNFNDPKNSESPSAANRTLVYMHDLARALLLLLSILLPHRMNSVNGNIVGRQETVSKGPRNLVNAAVKEEGASSKNWLRKERK